jgi:muramoyltetrapeptide carboxypeptidase
VSGLSALKPILPGARLAVLSLASSADPERIQRGAEALRRLGFEPVFGQCAFGKTPPYFAGSPEERLADLHWAFADPAIAAAFCTRGGYGSNDLLPAIDLRLVRANPKPFFGYSDLTAIQTWMLDRADLPSFHGPMVAADFSREDGVDIPSMRSAFAGLAYSLGPAEGLRGWQDGCATGILYGGCLSLLVASLGTPYAPQTEGKLLFLEDIGAKPYQVDRMLRQLLLAGKLEGVPGIVFGEMLDCASPGAPPELLEQAVRRVLHWFRGPIAFGLRSGHVSRANVTLTLGRPAELAVEGEGAVLRIGTE